MLTLCIQRVMGRPIQKHRNSYYLLPHAWSAVCIPAIHMHVYVFILYVFIYAFQTYIYICMYVFIHSRAIHLYAIHLYKCYMYVCLMLAWYVCMFLCRLCILGMHVCLLVCTLGMYAWYVYMLIMVILCVFSIRAGSTFLKLPTAST